MQRHDFPRLGVSGKMPLAANALRSIKDPVTTSFLTRLSRHPNRWLILIGVGKLLKAVLFIALGFGALKLLHRDLVDLVTHWVVDLRFDPEGQLVNFILDKVSLITPHRLRLISIGVFCYAAMDILEGVGLVLGKPWAEYLTLIVTASLLPVEFFEIFHKPSLPKILFTLVNIAVVWYLAAYLQKKVQAHRVERTISSAPANTE